jgi:outer membrane lipoprotein SlyB
MKKLILVVPFLLAAAACTPTQQGAAIGGLGGAAVGAAVDRDSVRGAVIGGAAGTIAGALIGRASEGSSQCVYRDQYGRQYTAACPRGY